MGFEQLHRLSAVSSFNGIEACPGKETRDKRAEGNLVFRHQNWEIFAVVQRRKSRAGR